MQAIERGSMKKLKYSIEAMKSLAENEHLDGNSYLNVCRLQTTVSKVSEKVVIYYTTLLALAGVYGELEMVEYLISEGTSKLMTDNWQCTAWQFHSVLVA